MSAITIDELLAHYDRRFVAWLLVNDYTWRPPDDFFPTLAHPERNIRLQTALAEAADGATTAQTARNVVAALHRLAGIDPEGELARRAEELSQELSVLRKIFASDCTADSEALRLAYDRGVRDERDRCLAVAHLAARFAGKCADTALERNWAAPAQAKARGRLETAEQVYREIASGNACDPAGELPEPLPTEYVYQ